MGPRRAAFILLCVSVSISFGIDFQLATHVILSPNENSNRQLHVTSGSPQPVTFHAMFLGRPKTMKTANVSATSPLVKDLHQFLPRISRDILKNIILLESTSPVTIILYSTDRSGDSFHSQLIFPTSVWSHEYMIYPQGPKMHAKNIYVALEKGETRVRIKSSTGEEKDIVLAEHQAKSSAFSLTSVLHVRADKKIAAFRRVIHKYSGSVFGFLHRYLPVELLSNRYMSLPVPPLSPDSKASLIYMVTSVNPRTELSYADYSSRKRVVKLPKTGTKTTINLSSAGSQIIGTEPFYLAKGGCPMPILPETLWKTSYHFTASMNLSDPAHVQVVVIYSSSIERPMILLDDKSVKDLVCPNSNDGDIFKFCYFHLAKGHHSLKFKQGNLFMAYMSGKRKNKYFCHPLGLNQPEPAKINIPTTTSDPETSELTTETTTTTEISTEIANMKMSTAQAEIPTTNESTTKKMSTIQSEVPTTPETSTKKMSTIQSEVPTTPETSTKKMSTIQSEVPTTPETSTKKVSTIQSEVPTTPETSTKKMSTIQSEVPTTPETTTFASADLPLCQTMALDVTNINDTKTREEVKKLRVNVTWTSSYQRKKTSAPDTRKSSQAIGIFSVVVIGSMVLIIVLPDVYSLLKYLYDLC